MPDDGIFEALLAGDGFVDLSDWRKVAVSGSDASAWLNDLVSADLTGLAARQSRRSLLLSPTGQVRAGFTVMPYRDGFLLLQDPAQPHALDGLLDRYVLSSDVALENLSKDLTLFAFPDRREPPGIGGDAVTPSCLGPGIDVLSDAGSHEEMLEALAPVFRKAAMEDVDTWRVFRGIPRVGVDVGEEDLPQEGGLQEAVSFEKGCYVGQEAVAKVRNLGHPRRLLLHLEASGRVSAGETVCVDSIEVGKVTSAVRTPRGARALAKVRWTAKGGPFMTTGGVRLDPVA
jgi:tRNA-modifying protein YgfZ